MVLIFRETFASAMLAPFGNHDELIVVHNMGPSCSYCTLWADGDNGIHQHVVSRAGFVVSSPDWPAVQTKLAEARGWKFPHH